MLFLIFSHDIGDCYTHRGIKLGESFIPFLQYADDLVILCETAEELQTQINNLVKYCEENFLLLNTKKTKVMIFHKGLLPKQDIFLNDIILEVVNKFKYLGFPFSCQLSFSTHLQNLNSKARSRIGLLFSRLPINRLPLALALKIFDIYVLSIYRYGLPMWINSCSITAMKELDSVYLKYLKR